MLASAQVEANLQNALSNGGHFHLVIVSGKDLIARDSNLFSKKSSDPYIVIKSGGTKKVGKTKTIPKHLSPVWNEEFSFDISPKEKPMVVLELYDYKKGPRYDDPMGIVTIPLSLLMTLEFHSIDKEFDVEQCKGAMEPNLGKVHVKATFDPIIPLAIKTGDVLPLYDSMITVGVGWDVKVTPREERNDRDVQEKKIMVSQAELNRSERDIGLSIDTASSPKSKRKEDKAQPGEGGGRKASYVANKSIDLDASAVVFDKKGQLVEAIYFDQLISSESSGKNAIVHFGDSQSGDEVENGIDEKIQIDLNKLGPDVLAIFICVCAFSDGSSFKDVVNARCMIFNTNTEIKLFDCSLGKLGSRTAVTMVRIYRDMSVASFPPERVESTKSTGSASTGDHKVLSERTGSEASANADPVVVSGGAGGGVWRMGTLFTMDSTARSWGFLIPQFKDNLGVDLVPGLRGSNNDRIAIMSKGQSFKIADTCDDIPDVFCVGLHWDVTEGKNIDLDASILLLNENYEKVDHVAYDKLYTKTLSVRHLGDEKCGAEAGDDETIIIDFGRLNKKAHYLCVVINSFSGEELDDVKGAGCHIYDNESKRDICRINLSMEQSMDGKTACFVACFFRIETAWWLKSVNQGMMGKTVRQSLPDIFEYMKQKNLVESKIMELANLEEAAQTFDHVSPPMSPDRFNEDDISSMPAKFNMFKSSSPTNGGGVLGCMDFGHSPSMDSFVSTGNLRFARASMDKDLAGTAEVSSTGQLLGGMLGTKVNGGHTGSICEYTTVEHTEFIQGFDMSINVEAANKTVSMLQGIGKQVPLFHELNKLFTNLVSIAINAVHNRLAAKLLIVRILEVASVLYDMFKDVTASSPSVDLELNRLITCLTKYQETLEKYSKRNYLPKIMCGYSEQENLVLMDRNIIDVMDAIAMLLSAPRVKFAEHRLSKLEDLAELIRITGKSSQSGQPLSESSQAVQIIAQCVGLEAKEVMAEIQNSLDAIVKSQDEISSKLDHAMRVLDLATSVIKRLSKGKPPPDDPRSFWNTRFADFGKDKAVPVDVFIPIFEEEFCPDNQSKRLTDEERQALIKVIDAYPRDGMVSIVEWRRLCKQATRAQLGLYDFISYIADEEFDRVM